MAITVMIELPNFSSSYIKTADKQLFKELEQVDNEIKRYLSNTKQENWDEICQPLINLENNILLQWSVISHLNNVASDTDIRHLYEKCLPKIIDFQLKLNQNPALYKEISRLDNHPSLSFAQKKAILNSLKDFKLTGVHLPNNDKEKLKSLQHSLSNLQNKFSQNTIDCAKEWKYLIIKEEKLEGIPKKEKDSFKIQNGWQIGADFHSFHVVSKYAKNRELREKVYYHYVTQCSEFNKSNYDNSQIMIDILSNRQSIAKILSFDDYMDLSLFNKMAESKQKVNTFLNNLITRARPLAKKEWTTLCSFARKSKLDDSLEAWDVAYFSNLLREKKFNYNEENLREFFPLTKVLSGLFAIVSKLFSIKVKEEKQAISTWHPDVRLFSIFKEDKLIGQFYLDIYARNNKRSGAWMDECKIRNKINKTKLQLPVAYLICNFNKPKSGNPTLLYHSEVVTLFHEFGHTLHHLLTKIDIMPVAGIQGVPWDAVEVPSQLLENWCWQPETMPYISEHYLNKKPLPNESLTTLIKARNFQAGLKLMRQLEFALFDYELHQKQEKTINVQLILNNTRLKTSLYTIPDYNRFPNTFNHIFSGGYAAGYYSYLWAEVIACDLFSIFKEKGILNNQVGSQFIDTYLGQGGSQCPNELFKKFSGRDFSIEPFFQHHGLNET